MLHNHNDVLFILIFFFFLFNCNCILSNKLCPQIKISETPTKFAIHTMTYIRPNQLEKADTFHKYLNHYANLKCQFFDNIYIIWNNQQSPQEKGIEISKNWIKNVSFIKTPYNSLGWKYITPQSAPQQLFLAMDDDLLLTCDQLKKGFQTWKHQSIGSIGPLVSYSPRTINYNLKKQYFTYQTDHIQHFYAISLMGCAFFTKQFANLYYSEFNQIRSIRREVQFLNNCEDIALNFIVSYFYPQLLPKIQNNTLIIDINVGLSSTPQHFKKRNYCINIFSDYLTYNPLRYIQTQQLTQKQFDISCNILLKHEFYKKIIKSKTPEQVFDSDKQFNPKNYPQHWQKVSQKQKRSRKSFYEFLSENTISIIELLIIIVLCLLIWRQNKRSCTFFQQNNKEKKKSQITNYSKPIQQSQIMTYQSTKMIENIEDEISSSYFQQTRMQTNQ